MIKKIIIPFVLVLSLIGCKNENQDSSVENKENQVSTKLDSILNNYYEDGLKLNPVSATTSGDMRYNDRFPNFLSSAYEDSLRNYYTKYRDVVSQINDEDLSATEKLSKDILLWECDLNLGTLEFKKNKYMPIDQMWSVNLFMGQLASGASAQPFKTVEDYENWLKRVDGFLTWMDSAEENMRKGMELGYVLPASLIKKVIPQMKSMTNPEVEDHLFYSPVKNFPDSFSEEEKQRLTEEYTKMIREKVIPQYNKMHSFMKDEYLPKGRESSGIADIPEGEEYYKHQIKLYTTTDMTAEEIHQLGLDEVARISKEMEKVKKEVGYEGDLKSFFNYVRENKDLMPFTKPEEVIANFEKIHERMKPNISKLFSETPETAFEVRRTEEFREKSASAQYNPGSLDGSRPGIFYVPIPDASGYNIYSDESLFLHEAIPGHHYQISLTQENEELPDFRKTLWYSGYGEGWALYSESLGEELGLFTDPYQYFGMLGAEMHRAVRLVVDTGLHSKGWTREEAIQYSLENEAEPKASVISEIERYMANPGQALSYKIGQLKIMELRDRAQQQMGEAFDIREYHKQVLETGCVPLELLENKIDNWIAEAK
ncbi:uncharacterized protein (DUF885 family) [Christiangramia gaetbulicola]|uniref:Uncharacterized protein (DUF885 family) n=1 Tax=Christiangramia gaetbulicola TaxID=703340 RepID=A0A2T6AN72_9FLAO|nr:DUF885 domain-containing protein [Christiangramia gaetbulicola]PTX45269.1 uncharacterized protein (DUF885 family) [Christiangramia gaetbulicola]